MYVDVPGGLNLSLSLPLVIGTIPLHAGASRSSSVSSCCSTASWLGLSPEGEKQHAHACSPVAAHGLANLLVCRSQRRRVTAIWRYRSPTGGSVCGAVTGATGGRTGGLCSLTSPSSDICPPHSTARYSRYTHTYSKSTQSIQLGCSITVHRIYSIFLEYLMLEVKQL